mgnify:CR=1 FL=1
MEVLALRPAPIQISFLGFAGTTGAIVNGERIVDFIVVDPTIVPENERHDGSYSERLIVMPSTYQPRDSSDMVALSDPPLTREHVDVALPADAFVFTCFNRCT